MGPVYRAPESKSRAVEPPAGSSPYSPLDPSAPLGMMARVYERRSESATRTDSELAGRTPSAGARRTPRQVVAAACTGVLVVLAFPLYGGECGLEHLVWVAFMPLILAAHGAGTRRGFFLGWIAGMTLETAGFVWVLYAIRSFGVPGAIGSSLLFAAFVAFSTVPWALFGALLGRARVPAALVWVIPLWIAIEHFYPRIWPWHIGAVFYARPWLLQCVDLFGASGLTALVLLVNVTLARVVLALRARERLPRGAIVSATVLVVAATTYGALRLRAIDALQHGWPEIDVGFVHGSLSPEERGARGGELHTRWTSELVREHPEVDLVIWPEGADSPDFFDLSDGADAWWFHRGAPDARGASSAHVRIRDDFEVPLVIGATGVSLAPGRSSRATTAASREPPRRYNVAAYVRADDGVEFYRKNRPVPFGESLPFVDLLPSSWRDAVYETFPNVGTLDLGDDNPPMALGDLTFRNLVCYEAVIPECVRSASIGSDFLVNVTEDIWYGRTAHIPQHRAVLIVRAVESRIAIARVSNVGPSGVVDISGRFASGGEIFGEGRFVRPMRAGRAGSFYRDGGHWFPLAALIAGLLRWAGARAARGRGGSRFRGEG